MYKLLSCLLISCVLQSPVLSHDGEGRVTETSVALLCHDLGSAVSDAELLYAQYSSRASNCLKAFLARSHSIGNDTLDKVEHKVLAYGPSSCRSRFAHKVRNIRHQAHVEAEYNAENHQKFFLAYMIVQRMHLNKTSLFIKRAEGGLRTCSSSCNSPAMQKKLFRWQQTARYELHKANEHIQNSRSAYRDLLTHSSKRLGRIDKRANKLIQEAVSELYECTNRV